MNPRYLLIDESIPTTHTRLDWRLGDALEGG